MLGQFDLGEVAFADGFQEPVAADVGLLVCCGLGHVAAPPGLGVGVRLQRKRERERENSLGHCFFQPFQTTVLHLGTVMKVEPKRTDGRFAEQCFNNILIRAR